MQLGGLQAPSYIIPVRNSIPDWNSKCPNVVDVHHSNRWSTLFSIFIAFCYEDSLFFLPLSLVSFLVYWQGVSTVDLAQMIKRHASIQDKFVCGIPFIRCKMWSNYEMKTSFKSFLAVPQIISNLPVLFSLLKTFDYILLFIWWYLMLYEEMDQLEKCGGLKLSYY